MERATENQLHEMSIVDHTGDTKILWDKDKPKEVEHARETFNALRKKGYDAFRVGPDGKKTELLREFDPNVEAMILSERLVGG